MRVAKKVSFEPCMNKSFNKNAKFEQLTKMLFSCEEEKGLIVKDPLVCCSVH